MNMRFSNGKLREVQMVASEEANVLSYWVDDNPGREPLFVVSVTREGETVRLYLEVDQAQKLAEVITEDIPLLR